MAWHITKDWADDGDAIGQWNARLRPENDNIEYCKKLCTEKFRMYDDDGELYYEGYSNDSSSFQPLDDFGMPNAGCTEIKYYENGKWETL